MKELKIKKKAVSQGDGASERHLDLIESEAMPSADERFELVQRIRKGDPDALEGHRCRNLRLTVSAAKRCPCIVFSLDERISSAGDLGLMMYRKLQVRPEEVFLLYGKVNLLFEFVNFPINTSSDKG